MKVKHKSLKNTDINLPGGPYRIDSNGIVDLPEYVVAGLLPHKNWKMMPGDVTQPATSAAKKIEKTEKKVAKAKLKVKAKARLPITEESEKVKPKPKAKAKAKVIEVHNGMFKDTLLDIAHEVGAEYTMKMNKKELIRAIRKAQK
jgi:hypothetical protein